MSTTSMRSRASCLASATDPAMPTTSRSGSLLEQPGERVGQQLVVVHQEHPGRSRVAGHARSLHRPGGRGPPVRADGSTGPGARPNPACDTRGHARGDARLRSDRWIHRPGAGRPRRRVAWSRPGRPSGRGSGRGRSRTGSSPTAAATPEAALAGADLVVLAAPPTTCIALLDELAGPWRGGARTGRRADRRGQHQGGHHPARGGARPAVRGRASDGRPGTDAATRRRRPTCSRAGRGSSCRPPSPADDERVRALARRLRRPARCP